MRHSVSDLAASPPPAETQVEADQSESGTAFGARLLRAALVGLLVGVLLFFSLSLLVVDSSFVYQGF